MAAKKKTASKKAATKKAASKKAAATKPAKKAAAQPAQKAATKPAKKAAVKKAAPKATPETKAAPKKAGAKPAPPEAPIAAASAPQEQHPAAAKKRPVSASEAVARAAAALMPDDDPDAVDEPEVTRSAVEQLPPMPRMPKRRDDGVITLAYATESDQAFMIYALATEQVDTEDRRYEFVRGELQELERAAAKVQHDVVSISFGAYTRLRDRYVLLACGGAYGDHQGPILVARKPIRSEEVEGLEVAVPGEDSAAALALRLWLPKSRLVFRTMPTREISLRVRANHIRAGLLVNEDVITYRNHNLMRVVDLGHWWGERTEGLPLAIHAPVIRRDIPSDQRLKIALDMKRSIAYALGHREEALDYAMQFAGKNTRETVDRYISRYVNDLSLDCGERGRQAARKLYEEAHRHGFLTAVPEPVYHADEGLP